MRSKNFSRLFLAGAVLATALSPNEADACGGTFCDSGPQAMPVDQSGENILFVVDDGKTEAHVQIQYTGDPERFAWVVPMPSIPEIEVSSSQLFSNLLQGTVPTYGFNTSFDMCAGQQRGGVATGAPGSFNDGSGGMSGAPEGPTVALRKTVGVFDVVVLEGGTAAEVTEWLVANNYQTTESAPAMLQPYVDQGSVFAAVKLVAGAGLDEIHPIMFRYEGTTPAIPIKLTAIAATPDMGVRTFFLSQERVVPTNYRHMVLNSVRIDWANFGSNYTDVVSGGADSAMADGHAFATEYAGPSNIIGLGGVFSTEWDSTLFTEIDPMLVLDELQVQGLASCSPGFCQYNHPLVEPILEEYLPRPAGVSGDDFYSCLSCYTDQIDQTAWDGVAFAAALQERIIAPGLHAQDIFARNPYLTRMFTTISADEMTMDPKFAEVAGLEDVAAPTFANRRTLCNGSNVMELPDGRMVAMPDANTWPQFDDESMPWVERLEEFEEDGTVRILTSHATDVDNELERNNARLGFRGPGSDSGCACSVPGANSSSSTTPGALAALVGIGLVGFGMRRRRR